MTPLSERGSAVLLEDMAAVEVAVLVEVVVDRGMGGGEFLQGLYISELCHRSFSSSERLVGIFGSIFEPPTALLIGSTAIPAFRRENRKYLAFVINRTPQVVRLAIDPDEHLVQVPSPLGK